MKITVNINFSKILALSSPNGLALSPSKGVKLDKPSQILGNKTWVDKERVKEWLLKNGVQPTQRAETLTLEDWLKLTKSWYKI